MEITLERSFICEEEEKSDTEASSGCHIKLGSFGYFCLFLDCFLFLINERCYYIYFTQIHTFVSILVKFSMVGKVGTEEGNNP